MIDILQGDGADWSDFSMSTDDMCDALESLTEDERFELGFSAFHERRAWEREAQERIAKRWANKMIENFTILADLAERDGDMVSASRYHMMIAAEEMGQEAQAVCRTIETVDDLKGLIMEQGSISPA